jgi:hypothetical protein
MAEANESQRSPPVFLVDEPIPSSKEDILGRRPFADALAEAILLQTGTEPIVIGLLGAWGCGKSSILRMMIESLEERAATMPEEKLPILVPFNPWMVADQAALFTQFFDEIINALGKINYPKAIRKMAQLGATLQSYSEALGVASISPTLTGKLIAMVPKILKGVTWFTTWASLRADSPQTLKKVLDDALRSQAQKLVIVIDDIDRLTTAEVCQIFQLVKSLANFPNTIYVLAFDNKVVETQLKGMQTEDGAAFLEKIVQVPFRVPQIFVDDVHRYTRAALLEICRGDDSFDEKHFQFLFQNGIRPLLDNLRDVKRFLNVLRFTANVCRGKIAVTDTIGLTALHVLEPEVFDEVRASKALLTGPCGPGTLEGEVGRQDALSRMHVIAKQQRNGSEVPVNAILALIFPKAHVIFNSKQEAVGHELKAEWRVKGRICDPQNFDYFFKLSLPRDEYSNAEIAAALQSATTGQDWESTFKRAQAHGRLRRLLEGFKLHIAHVPLRWPVIGSLIATLADIGDELVAVEPPSEAQTHSTDLQFLIFDCIKAAADCITSANAREHWISDAINRAERSIMVPMMLNQPVFNHSEAMTKAICERIARWAKNGLLIKHHRVGAILNYWQANGADPEQISAFIDRIIEDGHSLLNVIREHVDHNPSQASQDYYSTTPIRVHTESLKQRMNLAQVYQRLRIIPMQGLSDRDKSLIRATMEALMEYKGNQ